MVDRLALPEGVCEQSVSIDIFNIGTLKNNNVFEYYIFEFYIDILVSKRMID